MSLTHRLTQNGFNSKTDVDVEKQELAFIASGNAL